jgi:microcin C transport system substrate-binding protein
LRGQPRRTHWGISLGSPGSRQAVLYGLCVIWAATAAMAAAAQDGRHGLSAFGQLSYPADFSHFLWVNPDAPKGGRLAMIGPQARTSFDSFNEFILKGDPAQGLALLFDSLMTRSYDEPDAVYGLVAQSAEVADRGGVVRFHLRPEAKFADGSSITADDVVFTFNILKDKGHPSYGLQLKDVTKAEALDTLTVAYTLTGTQTRDLPLLVATLPILSKAYYSTHEFNQTTLDPPLGSGPYTIGAFKQGTFVSFKRRADYWAKDLPVMRGRFNFDEVRYEYFRDRTAELESLKAGDYDLREEFTSRDWVTAYDFPAVKQGRLVRLTLPDETPSGAQGYFLNTRKPKLADVRVRKALDYAFDFEWTNKNLFYGLYGRTDSFFENSSMKATGPPSAAELALLEPFRSELDPDVFGEPYRSPVSDGSGQDRQNLREAARLLAEAGYALKSTRRVDGQGQPLELEFLVTDPTSERILSPYVKNLEALGIGATIRRVDPAQYERRLKIFDFDVVSQRYAMRLTPGVELRSYWGSQAAGSEGTANLSGIRSPVVDALIAKVEQAKSRADLETATRALDSVLRAGHYWVPHWYAAVHRLVFWDKFGRPAVAPRYERGITDTWWYDADRAAKLTINR